MPDANPPDFVVRTALEKAAGDKGWRLPRGEDGPWLAFDSTTEAVGRIWVAAAGPDGPWLLAVGHPGVAAELGSSARVAGPGLARFAFDRLAGLYDGLDRAWHLGLSLPTAPLQQFRSSTTGLPQTTEAERLVVQRIGQDLFREALLNYWGCRCPLTGIAEPELLRASHIVAWAECDDDAHRLDAHNGLLLSGLWDLAFDKGLVSFADDGTPLYSARLSPQARRHLESNATLAGRLTDGHRRNLMRHRMAHGYP